VIRFGRPFFVSGLNNKPSRENEMAKRRKSRRACVKSGKTVVCGRVVKMPKGSKKKTTRRRRQRSHRK
jgi:hypothetical protein